MEGEISRGRIDHLPELGAGIGLNIPATEIHVRPGDSVSVAVWVRNRTDVPITFTMRHESDIGEWPPNPLFIRNDDGEELPLYLYGEENASQEITVDADGYEFIDVRLDWPGTVSVKARRWIDPEEDATVSFELFLVLESGRRGFVRKKTGVTVKRGKQTPGLELVGKTPDEVLESWGEPYRRGRHLWVYDRNHDGTLGYQDIVKFSEGHVAELGSTREFLGCILEM